jgi:hypothetical protein
MCNIPINICNFRMEHLQHTSETLETDACSMCFVPSVRRSVERGTAGSSQRVAEDVGCGLAVASCACAWPANDASLSWAPGLGAAGAEEPLHSLTKRMELGGAGRGADNQVRRQLQSAGWLASYLTWRIPPLCGRGGAAGIGGRRGWQVATSRQSERLRGTEAEARWMGRSNGRTVP